MLHSQFRMQYETGYISISKYPLENLNEDVVIYIVIYYCTFVKAVSIKGTNIIHLTQYIQVIRNLKDIKVKKTYFPPPYDKIVDNFM